MVVPMTSDFGMPCSNEDRGRLWRSPVCDRGAGLTFDERERAARSARPSRRDHAEATTGSSGEGA